MVGGVFAAKAHQRIVRNPKLLTQTSQVLFNQIGVEAIVTGRHRSVGGEDHFPRNEAGGSGEVEAFFAHAIADCLEHCEAAVSLVEMEHSRGDAHCLECAKTAYTEK